MVGGRKVWDTRFERKVESGLIELVAGVSFSRLRGCRLKMQGVAKDAWGY